jgi:hypothetical protein
MLDILIEIFPEFGLPEPETDYSIELESNEFQFIFAWPNNKIGIKQ